MEIKRIRLPGENTPCITKYKYSGEAVPPDDPDKVKTDAKLYNEKEWYEARPMIVDLYRHFTSDDKKSACDKLHIIETLIRERPADVRTHDQVFAHVIIEI